MCRSVLGTEGAKRSEGGKKRQKWIDRERDYIRGQMIRGML